MFPAPSPTAPIGIFDSGVGGLSVLRHLRTLLPHERFIYLADQANVPYGPRSPDEIRRLSEAVARFFLAQPVKLIVVACNTASAAALSFLRGRFPDTDFVGMEPAVKPAAAQTRTGKVGVLATAGTFESQRYADLMARFAQDVVLYEDPCDGLVELIEAGTAVSPQTTQLLRPILHPMLAAGVDTLVLGCTHYPFAIPVIEQIVAEAPHPVTIIDPAPAVARQARRVLAQRERPAPAAQKGSLRLLTTGARERFSELAATLLDERQVVETAVWRDGNLMLL